MVDIGVAFGLLELAVAKVYTIYKSHKHLKQELEEVGNLILDLQSSPILTKTLRSCNLEHVKKNLHKKLESATKQVEGWSSMKPGLSSIILHSDQRLKEVQDVRKNVKRAMDDARTEVDLFIFQVTESTHKLLSDHIRKINGSAHKPRLDPQQHPKQPQVAPKPSPPGPKAPPKGHQHPKPQTRKVVDPPRSRSTTRPTSSRQPRSSPQPRSKSVSRRDQTVELFVPMDSEKQMKDVVEILEAIPGVQKAHADQTSKKVIVVPQKGYTLDTDILLRQAQLKNKYVRSTLWRQRPR